MERRRWKEERLDECIRERTEKSEADQMSLFFFLIKASGS